MSRILLMAGMTLVFVSCFPAGKDLYDVNPKFKTTESSVLFFRNTRLAFYNYSERSEASIELYHPKEPTGAADAPGYAWFIAYNRLQGKAMPFHEATESLKKDPCVGVDWEWKKPDDTTAVVATLPCPGIDPENNFQFLVRSYRQLDAGRVGYLKLKSGRSEPLFAQEENQRRFVRLVRDYLEMVDLI